MPSSAAARSTVAARSRTSTSRPSASVRTTTSPVSLGGCRQVPVPDRLQLVGHGRQPSALLHLQGQLPRGGVVGPRSNRHQPVDGREAAGQPLGRRVIGSGRHLAFDGFCRDVGPQQRGMETGAGDQRREIADGVAPGLVLLSGGDHVAGDGGAGGAVADRDQGGRAVRPASPAQGLVGGIGAALVRDRDDHATVRWPSGQLERLHRPHMAAARLRAEAVRDQVCHRHRRVLARAAAGGRHRKPRLDGVPDGFRHPFERRIGLEAHRPAVPRAPARPRSSRSSRTAGRPARPASPTRPTDRGRPGSGAAGSNGIRSILPADQPVARPRATIG